MIVKKVKVELEICFNDEEDIEMEMDGLREYIDMKGNVLKLNYDVKRVKIKEEDIW